MTDIRQTPEYAKYLESIGWIVEEKDKVFYFIKKIPILGSIIKIQRPEKLPSYKVIALLSRKYRAFQIVIEPKEENQESRIKNHGFKLSKTPFLPSKTIQIDLTKAEERLLKEMHYKTRYNIKIAEKKEVEIKLSDEIKTFAKFWNIESLKQKRFIPQGKEIKELFKAFGQKSDLLLAYKKEKLLGGVLMLRTPKIAYYMYAVSSNEGKKLFVPTFLAWEALKLAKRKSAKIFDFEGVYDERFPLPAWHGFTRFKKSFGGQEISFPGAYTKNLLPLRI